MLAYTASNAVVGDIAVASGATVQFRIAAYNGVVSGAGGLTRILSGTFTLNGANTYTGTTSVSGGGIIKLGTTGSLATGTTLSIGNLGTFDLNGKTQTVAGLSGDASNAVLALGAGSLTVNGSANGTYYGTITGTGSFIKAGSGTQTFRGDSSYSGGTTINGGALQLGVGGTIGSITGNIVNNAALIFNRGTAWTYAGVVSGTGTLDKQGLGTLTLDGASTYTGTTTVTAGTLKLGTGSLAAGTSLALNGGTFDLNGHTQTVAGLSGNASSAVLALGAGGLTVNASADGTYLGTITGTGSFIKAGSGTQTFGGAASYSGGTTINGGTLVAGSNDALGSGTATIAAGGTLRVGSGVTLANAIALTGGAISGTGILTADLVIQNDSTLAPGNSPGTLYGANVTFGPGGNYAFEVRNFDGLAGSDWDLLRLTGTLALTATALDPVLIRLTSLDASDNPGLAANFRPGNRLSLKLIEFTAVTGFDAAMFRIDSSGFQNPTNGGTWSVSADANGLFLDFTPAAAPEPASLALLALGAGLLAARRRRAGAVR